MMGMCTEYLPHDFLLIFICVMIVVYLKTADYSDIHCTETINIKHTVLHATVLHVYYAE